MPERRSTTISGPNGTLITIYEEQPDGSWKQVSSVLSVHPVGQPDEQQRLLPDGRYAHPQPVQELPVDLPYADKLTEAQLQHAAVDKAKRDARRM